MKVVIVQKWPVWLKTQVVDSYFSNKNQIEVENDDSFIPENSIQCLPDNYPSELDIASKSLAITRLKNVVNSIEKDVDVLVFINGINIDEKIQQLKDASDRANELANKARDVASAAEKEMQKANPCN